MRVDGFVIYAGCTPTWIDDIDLFVGGLAEGAAISASASLLPHSARAIVPVCLSADSPVALPVLAL
jgi:hypothetical protein